METGIAATPAEADHHRLSGALSMIERIIPRVADEAGNADGNDDDLFERKQTSAALGMLFGVWDDLFEDPQLTDPRCYRAEGRTGGDIAPVPGRTVDARRDPDVLGAVVAAPV